MTTREAWNDGLNRAIVAAADASGVICDDIDTDVVQAVYESVMGARPPVRDLYVERRDHVEEFSLADHNDRTVKISDSCDYVSIHKEDIPKVINWLGSV